MSRGNCPQNASNTGRRKQTAKGVVSDTLTHTHLERDGNFLSHRKGTNVKEEKTGKGTFTSWEGLQERKGICTLCLSTQSVVLFRVRLSCLLSPFGVILSLSLLVKTLSPEGIMTGFTDMRLTFSSHVPCQYFT